MDTCGPRGRLARFAGFPDARKRPQCARVRHNRPVARQISAPLGQLSLGLADDPVAIVDMLSSALLLESPGQLLVREMCTRRGGSRIDLAAIGSALRGFEIKSSRDDLRRLPAQVEAYGAVFDELTLVAPPRHVDEAASWLPAWWGLMIVRAEGDATEWRRPMRNPEQDPAALARLLWHDELSRALGAHAATPRRAARLDLARELVGALGSDDVRRVVVAALSARGAWRAAA